MAATASCALLDCSTQLSCLRAPASSRRFASPSSGCTIVCKTQRHSRYEKSKKHARQGHATIPQHGPVVPSKLRSGPAPRAQVRTKPGTMEARKERGSSHPEPDHVEESSFAQTLSVSATVAEEMQATAKGVSAEIPSGSLVETPQPVAQEATEKLSGSHWDDFWAPRLFWVFRALGTVVD
ncbi:hypothetical protein KFL_001750140 [Klebsormidium nitens]|uniref:Uncharacterized protein n=1 Tax=Klebsormidium nitens TaxID=105231 RepID=A0A1Y1I5S3_KLENI|nr:hypothetical protein KFL_001750140 [Klebsormidium nitens]|eukprot:GAQ84077.1 hypothetical protein KFL_001750140 [Klebsormidium nitens]